MSHTRNTRRLPTAEQVVAYCTVYREFLAECQAGTTDRRALMMQLPAITDDEGANVRLAAAIAVARDKCRIVPTGSGAGGPQRKKRTAEQGR